MSEVKWVNEWYSRQDQVPVERIPGGALETVAVPILTLDDIEAWLRAEKDKRDRITDLLLFDHLITQVQAMKEGRT